MIRTAVLALAVLVVAACAPTPPPACRGEMFSLNAPLVVGGAPQLVNR